LTSSASEALTASKRCLSRSSSSFSVFCKARSFFLVP
jgi:hypothetical protein